VDKEAAERYVLGSVELMRLRKRVGAGAAWVGEHDEMKKGILVVLLATVPEFLFCQEKIVNVLIPPEILRVSYDDELMVFEIRTNEDGLINTIDAINGFGFVAPAIIIGEGRITISSEEEIYAINDILLSHNEIYVRGGSGSVYTRNDDYLPITIGNDEKTIYEHDEMRMEKPSEKSLIEVFKVDRSRYSAVVYADNILRVDYIFQNNTMRTHEYRSDNGRTIVAYSDMQDKYPRVIEIYGDKLYNHNKTANIVNYFILLSVHPFLARMLSPMIFLEDPF
jgi:hypothetical protein